MKFKTPQAAVVAGALRAYLAPKLAQDAAIGDLGALVANVKAATFAKEHPAIASQVKAQFGGKLAQDTNLDGLQAFLSTLAMDADSDDDMKAEDGLDDDDEEEKKKKLAADEPGSGNGEGNTPGGPKANTNQAMDAASVQRLIATAVANTKAEVEGLSIARAAVAPLVGHVALDSADAVYKFALDHAQIDTAGVHASAYPALLKMHMTAKTAAPSPRMAVDAASVKAAGEQFGINRFGKI